MTRVIALSRQLQLVAKMSERWFQEFADRYGFPANYTCVDCETNGVDVERSLICSIGHTIVRDGVPIETREVYLNWPDFPDIDHEDFQRKLYQTQQAMQSRGKGFHHTWERLRNEGEDPIATLEQYLTMFEDMEERREVVVAHNGWRFDIELFQAHFHNFLRIPFVFEPELVYDSGIVEKASQLDDYDDPLPLPGETMQQWAWRIGELRRRGVMWSLEGHCDDKYRIFEKAGVGKEEAHAAGVDSLVLHYLVEEHRKLAGVAPLVEEVTDHTQVIVNGESEAAQGSGDPSE